MKVYRYMSETELNAILHNNMDNIGHYFDRKDYKRQNTHRYRRDTKYMHFYKNKADMEYIRREMLSKQNDVNYYFTSFNVPDFVLFFRRGRGRYDGNMDVNIMDVVEYAVPIRLIEPSMLDKYILDDKKPRSYMDNRSSDEILDSIKRGEYKSIEWGHDLEL